MRDYDSRTTTRFEDGVHYGARKVALVEKFTCGRCWRTHIRSAPDAVTDNNLDNLRRCNWE
jgi:hypothetical protein